MNVHEESEPSTVSTYCPINAAAACFLSSTPVFDRERAVYAHTVAAHVCFAPTTDTEMEPESDEQSTFCWLVSEGLPEIERLAEEHGKLFLPIPNSALTASEVGLFPWDNSVLVITPPKHPTEEYVESCQAILASGYQLGVRLEDGAQGLEAVLGLADVIIYDFSVLRPLEVAKLRKDLKDYSALTMASNVDSWEAVTGAKALGFDLTQGSFFGRPEILKGQKLQANSITRLELMGVLNSPNTTFKDIGTIISKDAFLSYRLMRYVNSPDLGLGRGVDSIDHAVALLGLQAFKQWAMMALVASLDASPKGEELAYLSLQRAGFLQNLAEQTPNSPYSPQSMFLFGLFSLLDAMMGQPMDLLLANVPMEEAMKQALCDRENALSPWLELLRAVDKNRWDTVKGFLATQGVPSAVAARAYLDASKWARVCFKAGKDSA